MFKKSFLTLILSLFALSVFISPVKAQENDFNWVPSEFELKSGRPGQKESSEVEFKNNLDLDVVFTSITIVESVNGTDTTIAKSSDKNLESNGKLHVSIDGLKDGKLVVGKSSKVKYKFNFTFPDNLKVGNYTYKIILNEDENSQILSGPIVMSMKAEIVNPTGMFTTEQLLLGLGVVGVICIVAIVAFIVVAMIRRKRNQNDDFE